MNLSEYILEFLLQDNVVTIRPFGTFRMEYVPAKFDKQTNSFAPSFKQIVLTNEDIDNEEFISFIVKKEDISEELALTFWNNYIALIKEKIETDNQCFLANLGCLAKNPKGGYSFMQDEVLDLEDNTFGFFTLNDIKVYQPKEPFKSEEKNIDKTLAEEKTQTTNEEPENIISVIINEEIEQKVIGSELVKENFSHQEEENVAEIIEEIETEDYTNEITEEKPLNSEDDTQTSSIETIVEKINEHPDLTEETALTTEPSEYMFEHKKELTSVDENTDVIDVQAENQTNNEEENIEKQPSTDIDETTSVPTPLLLEKKKNKKKRAWIFAIIVLLLLLLFIAYFLLCNAGALTFCNPFEKNNIKIKQNNVVEVKAVPLSVEKKDTIIVLEEPIITSNSLSQPDALRAIDGILFFRKSQKEIDIITGFFRVESNAIKQAQSMKEMGYDAYIVERMPFGQKQYFVSIGSFFGKEEAINFMREVSKSKKIDLVLKEWK